MNVFELSTQWFISSISGVVILIRRRIPPLRSHRSGTHKVCRRGRQPQPGPGIAPLPPTVIAGRRRTPPILLEVFIPSAPPVDVVVGGGRLGVVVVVPDGRGPVDRVAGVGLVVVVLAVVVVLPFPTPLHVFPQLP